MLSTILKGFVVSSKKDGQLLVFLIRLYVLMKLVSWLLHGEDCKFNC